MSQVGYIADDSCFSKIVQNSKLQLELLSQEMERLQKMADAQTAYLKEYQLFFDQLSLEYQEVLNMKQYKVAKEIVSAYVQRER